MNELLNQTSHLKSKVGSVEEHFNYFDLKIILQKLFELK